MTGWRGSVALYQPVCSPEPSDGAILPLRPNGEREAQAVPVLTNPIVMMFACLICRLTMRPNICARGAWRGGGCILRGWGGGARIRVFYSKTVDRGTFLKKGWEKCA